MLIHTNIKDFVNGSKVSGTYVLKTLTIASKKDGSEYLRMVLSDESGEIPANKWDMPSSAKDLIQGGLADVTMTIGEYQGALQAKVDTIAYKDVKDLINGTGIIPTSPISAEKMYEDLVHLAESFADDELKKVLLTALDEKKDGLLVTPAAMKMHQAVVGGLLWHVRDLINIASGFVRVYPMVNKELLYTGIILHDIGKLEEFTLGPVGLVQDYSETGRLEGHLYMGAVYVRTLCERLSVSEEKKILLEHMILSHHGQPEWGAVVRPQTIEAYLMHKCDEIDATMFQYLEAYKELEPGTFSTKRVHDAFVYRPKI